MFGKESFFLVEKINFDYKKYVIDKISCMQSKNSSKFAAKLLFRFFFHF